MHAQSPVPMEHMQRSFDYLVSIFLNYVKNHWENSWNSTGSPESPNLTFCTIVILLIDDYKTALF